jgi:hypothetical protein
MYTITCFKYRWILLLFYYTKILSKNIIGINNENDLVLLTQKFLLPIMLDSITRYAI